MFPPKLCNVCRRKKKGELKGIGIFIKQTQRKTNDGNNNDRKMK